MEDPEMMIGPVAEALGVTRTWLLSTDDPLQEHIDLPVSLMVELMDAADCLYPTEEQRWRQLRGWLSRLTGRSAAEFERAAPLMQAVRRQFRLSRDEDLQAVCVWRRSQPTPAELSKLQLTVRPENGARLRRLVQQLGSEEAAIDFLLQMDDNCGKGASLRRTRWPPKVHYESSRGQVKIDVGTEMVCVVLSQFKPSPAPPPEPAPAPVTVPAPLPTPPAPHSVVEVVSAAPEVLVVNGHTPSSSAAPAGSTAPPLSLASASASAYQTVVRDATLPAQMFADDDLAADQLSEVQNQLSSVLDQLAEDSNSMAEMPAPADGDQMVAEEVQVAVAPQGEAPAGHAAEGAEEAVPPQVASEGAGVVSEQTGGLTEMVVTAEQVVAEQVEAAPQVTEQAVSGMTAEEAHDGTEPADQVVSEESVGQTTEEEVALEGEQVALEGEEVSLEGEEVSLGGQEVSSEGQEVSLEGHEVSLEGSEVALEGDGATLEGEEIVLDQEVSLEGEEVALDADEVSQVALDTDEVSQVALDADEVSQVALDTDEVSQVALDTDEVSQVALDADEVSQVTLDADEVSQVALDADEVSQVELDADEVSQVALDTDEVSQVALDTDEVSQVALDTDEVSQVALDTDEVSQVVLDTDEVSPASVEAALEGQEATIDDQEVAELDQLEGEEVALDAELAEVAGDGGAMAEEPAAEVLTEVTEVTEITEGTGEQEMEQLQAEPLVELPEQLMESESDAGPSSASDNTQTIVIDADQLADAEQMDESMAEAADEPMEVGGEGDAETDPAPPPPAV